MGGGVGFPPVLVALNGYITLFFCFCFFLVSIIYLLYDIIIFFYVHVNTRYCISYTLIYSECVCGGGGAVVCEFDLPTILLYYPIFPIRWSDEMRTVLQKRPAWALFVLLFSSLVCCQPTELIWDFLFHTFSNFTLPPAAVLSTGFSSKTDLLITANHARAPITTR